MLGIFGALGIWIGAWILIIIIGYIDQRHYVKATPEQGSTDNIAFNLSKEEILKDANNLFSTGIVYTNQGDR